MSLVKVGPRHEVVIPKEVRNRLRLKPGDLVEISFEKKRPKKKQAPNYRVAASNETIGPKMRASVQRAIQELENGKSVEPFSNAEELIESLHAGAKHPRRGRPR